MAKKKADEQTSEFTPAGEGENLPERAKNIEESDADSSAETADRQKAAEEGLEERQDAAVADAVDADGNLPDTSPEARELDTDTMTDEELEALRTQNEIASEGYEPKSFDQFLSEVKDSPDINPEAKEFQLGADKPDEFVGPEAEQEAMATGVNPRSVATASDPEGMKQAGEVAPVSENAEPVSKSSPEGKPGRIEKVLD